MHNAQDMLKILVNLAIHFPQAGRSPQQLTILAEDWAEDLADYTLAVIEQAVKDVRREDRFFPCVADVAMRCARIKYASTLTTSRSIIKSIPAQTHTPIDFEHQARMARCLLTALGKK